MFRIIAKFIYFNLLGWKVEGAFPSLDKYIIIVAPHTSNWDFPVGLLGRSITNLHCKFLGKSSLFKPPFGWIFRALGGYPVDRSKNTNMVDAVVEIFNSKEQFVLALAPEGTRKKVEKFKSGFYFIAEKASVPIVMVGFDFPDGTIKISEPFRTTENQSQDFEYIMGWFKDIRGKIPENGIG